MFCNHPIKYLNLSNPIAFVNWSNRIKINFSFDGCDSQSLLFVYNINIQSILSSWTLTSPFIFLNLIIKQKVKNSILSESRKQFNCAEFVCVSSLLSLCSSRLPWLIAITLFLLLQLSLFSFCLLYLTL